MQQVLVDPKWADILTDADRRALSPLFWSHVNPYGRFELDMNRRLDLDLATRAVPGPRTLQGKGLPCRGEVWARSRCGPQGNQGCSAVAGHGYVDA